MRIEIDMFLYLLSLSEFGGGERDRTDDLLLAKQALSQLSYTPTFLKFQISNHQIPISIYFGTCNLEFDNSTQVDWWA